MTAIAAREGYRLWAPLYETETAVSYLEDQTVAELGVDTRGCTLLDVGCGTGRRLRESGAAVAIGIDLAPEMLRIARDARAVAAADVLALPFAAESFSVVWCRLMIGHVRDVATAYAELSRVCCPGGMVIVSDLCPEAVSAGHRRTFRDERGAIHEIEHFVHTGETQTDAAHEVGLALDMRRDGVVGPSIEPFYARAGRQQMYDAQRGFPIVRALSWRKRTA